MEPRLQRGIDAVHRKSLGIEGAVEFKHLPMHGVPAVGEGLEQECIAGNAANVFRRAAARACNAARIQHTLFRRQDRLKPDFVKPVVAEVVNVMEFFAFAAEQLIETEAPLVKHLARQELHAADRLSVCTAARVELVQVAVFPPKQALQDLMEPVERGVGRNL
jgi:hypothetical protein